MTCKDICETISKLYGLTADKWTEGSVALASAGLLVGAGQSGEEHTGRGRAFRNTRSNVQDGGSKGVDVR